MGDVDVSVLETRHYVLNISRSAISADVEAIRWFKSSRYGPLARAASWSDLASRPPAAWQAARTSGVHGCRSRQNANPLWRFAVASAYRGGIGLGAESAKRLLAANSTLKASSVVDRRSGAGNAAAIGMQSKIRHAVAQRRRAQTLPGASGRERAISRRADQLCMGRREKEDRRERQGSDESAFHGGGTFLKPLMLGSGAG
jgi:hypothetical protein